MTFPKTIFTATLAVILMSGFDFAQDTTLTVTGDGHVGVGITTPGQKNDSIFK